jgi:lipid II:glycine glycyltransferase (peptidoglycan interpeptide bridge formation enzyme)
MKKVVRLTESDLVRLVKRVIKEQEFEDDEFDMDMSMGSDCDEIISQMKYIFKDFIRYFKHSSPDTQSILGASDMYHDLESELGGLLDMAEENDCENRYDIESTYEELLNKFRKYTELDS